jgi:hypothetical protein
MDGPDDGHVLGYFVDEEVEKGFQDFFGVHVRGAVEGE